jgi:hypothetical protein
MSKESSLAPANILISTERLAELETIEAKYKLEQEKKKERLKTLEEKRTPESHLKQVMKHYELHKDEINAKRREKRRLAREAKEMAENQNLPENGLAVANKPH